MNVGDALLVFGFVFVGIPTIGMVAVLAEMLRGLR